jgi:hypothetical protein
MPSSFRIATAIPPDNMAMQTGDAWVSDFVQNGRYYGADYRD